MHRHVLTEPQEKLCLAKKIPTDQRVSLDLRDLNPIFCDVGSDFPDLNPINADIGLFRSLW